MLGLAAVLVAPVGVIFGAGIGAFCAALTRLALLVALHWLGAQHVVLTASAAACGLGWLAMLS